MPSVSETRGSGTTTRQMEAAPQGAVFVWCNNDLYYPQKLAEKLGRKDLKIVGPSWIALERYLGLKLSGLVLDHALRTDRPWSLDFQGKLEKAKLRVRT